MPELSETCPTCGSTVRAKLVLIDEAWIPSPDKDPREAHLVDLRVDDVNSENLREHPLGTR